MDKEFLSEEPPKKKCKTYVQKYLKDWEKEEDFKGWLSASSNGPSYFLCKPCGFNGKGGKSEILKHAKSQKHLAAVNVIKKHPPIFEMIKAVKEEKSEYKIKDAELKISAFIAEHDLPFKLLDHLPKLISSVCTDSVVAKKIRCGATKGNKLIKNVIGATNKEEVISDLQCKHFSLIIDEATDISCEKVLCLVVRYLSDDFVVNDNFLTLLTVKDATAQSLYKNIVDFFETNNIPYKDKMIGFASDGANNMMGKNNSVAALLSKDVDGLFLMKCICHSFHLCASYACEKLPDFVEDFARSVFNYFHSSPKRSYEFKEIQEYLELKPYKLLQPSQTRWLSLLNVVTRLLKNFAALKVYFAKAALYDSIQPAAHIHRLLENPLTELYLQFLEFILPLFNDLNREMQSEKPKIHMLYERIKSTYLLLLSYYMNQKYLDSLSETEIQYRDPRNYMPVEDIYLGGSVIESLLKKKYTDQEKSQFRNTCLAFYVEGAHQIYKRFPFKELHYLKEMKVILPSEALNREVRSIVPLAVNLPCLSKGVNMTSLDREWHLLKSMDINPSESLENFWKNISVMKKGDESELFPLLSEFVKKLLILPHSSAAVERIFSSVGRIKTKDRNSLQTDTVSGLLYAKQALRNSTCFDFKPSSNHYEKFDSKIYE